MSILEQVRQGFPHHRSALEGCEIRISHRLTRSAGNACAKTRTVGISAPIFTARENHPQFRNTVLHELAHVIAGSRVQAHGTRWRKIFIEIGGNGERCHEMRARGQHYQHQAVCQGCGSEVEVGTRVWNRLKAGSRDYYHQGCGGVVTAEIESPQNDQKSGMLQRIRGRLRQALLFGSTEKS